MYVSNPKHTLGKPGNRPNAGLEPSNSFELFGNSLVGSDGHRYARDPIDGSLHRFFYGNNGTWHWTGSTNQIYPRPCLTGNQVPNDVKNKLNLKKKGW